MAFVGVCTLHVFWHLENKILLYIIMLWQWYTAGFGYCIRPYCDNIVQLWWDVSLVSRVLSAFFVFFSLSHTLPINEMDFFAQLMILATVWEQDVTLTYKLAQTRSSVLLDLTHCMYCMCTWMHVRVQECVWRSVGRAGRTVQRGRISCYCLRKTVLQYRNVSYAMLFCYKHTHSHTHTRTVYETVVVLQCLAVWACAFKCVYVHRRCASVCVSDSLRWADIPGITSRPQGSDSNTCDEGHCTPAEGAKCVLCSCVCNNSFNCYEKAKIHRGLFECLKASECVITLVPAVKSPLACAYTHVFVTLTWMWNIALLVTTVPHAHHHDVSDVFVFVVFPKKDRKLRKIPQSEDILTSLA